MSDTLKNKQIPLIYLLLAAATIIAFWQVNQCDFINYDDTQYVTENIHIRNGITIGAIRWAFTTGYAANWHPLTWMSHMLDLQLFGLNPHRHHLVNLLFHVANTLLLFFVFHQMTKAPWKSAFVAALFGLHPLHVESVAWVSERKDVLSTFFWMLTMAAYIRYVENPRPKNCLVVLVFSVLGLMSKPMLVTLPFALLLTDYWPLGRMQGAGSGEHGAGSREPESLSANKRRGKSGKKRIGQGIVKEGKRVDHRLQWASVPPLIREKIPLFALAALSCIVTVVAQQKGGAFQSFEEFSPGVRVANALVSYITYVAKTIWPDNLALLYPHPGLRPLWQVVGAVLLLGGATFAVIRGAKRFPYLAVGWLWFAGTLVPVIGIVQVGAQAMADRYTYVPSIGLFIMAAWGVPELLKKWHFRKEMLLAPSALILACLSSVTWTQVGYWRSSISLYDHALKVTNNNYVMLNCRGLVYLKFGNLRQAILDFSEAIQVEPKFSWAYLHRGVAHEKLGDHGLAIADYDRAIDINSEDADAYANRGVAYAGLGNHEHAISDYDSAIEINPENAAVYNNRGVVYAELGNQEHAISDYNRAVEIDPKYPDAYNNRGNTYARRGNYRQAVEDYSKVIDLNPGYVRVYYNRGVAYHDLGLETEAIEDLKAAARLNDENAKNLLKSQGIRW